jgi:hypothetical protein
MKKWILPLLVLGLAVSNWGCYYDVDEELYGGPCDTTGTRYSTTVSTLLSNYGCVGCHSGTSASGGILLNNYAAVRVQVDNGKLLGAITHASGFAPMPQGAAKMNACDLARIRSWIAAGSPQN